MAKQKRSARDEKIAMFARAAGAGGTSGGRITEDDPRWDPRTMGNHRGSKGTRTTRMHGQYRPT